MYTYPTYAGQPIRGFPLGGIPQYGIPGTWGIAAVIREIIRLSSPITQFLRDLSHLNTN